jgi:UDP-glucuronate 4-epimerase
MELQAGDVLNTAASSALLEALIGYRPSTPIFTGVGEFVRWYREYYHIG